jgi:hypothetical protein
MSNNQTTTNTDQVFKWLGIIWSVIAFVLVIAFFAGGEWQDWQKVKSIVQSKDWDKISSQLNEIDQLKENSEALEHRISGIRLRAVDAGTDTFGCGGEGKAEAGTLKVMHGSRDGTSCSVTNVNYYKELILDIPD